MIIISLCCVFISIISPRTLENKVLSHVLGYVGKSPSSYLVCKYWKVTVDEQNKQQQKKAIVD